jgi:hypothetical protein
MRNLAGLLVLSQYPMKDGALDVYHVVAKDVSADKQLELLRSARTGIGPLRSEIQQGEARPARFHDTGSLLGHHPDHAGE